MPFASAIRPKATGNPKRSRAGAGFRTNENAITIQSAHHAEPFKVMVGRRGLASNSLLTTSRQQTRMIAANAAPVQVT